jgi:AMP-binding enzyme
MTPTESFLHARDVLLRNRDDLERARAEFKWPVLEEFNWAWDWFEVFAGGNEKTALVLVSDTHKVEKSSFASLAERSTRLGRWLRDQGVERGDRILVMLGNVVPLWETMLASMKIGAVVIPATTQLTESDVDDRIVRGNVRHIVADGPSAAKLREPRRLRVRVAVDRVPEFTPYEDAFAAPAALEPVRTRARPIPFFSTSPQARRQNRSLFCTPIKVIRSAICRRCTGSACSPATCISTSRALVGPSMPGPVCSPRGLPARRSACSTTTGSTRLPCWRSCAIRR